MAGYLSKVEAQSVMLAAQGLLDGSPSPIDAVRVRSLIDRLGVVQIDTISVVERTQYLVLWSRLGAYDASLLDRLLYPDRLVFEYWSHAASIVPMSEYRLYRPKMLRYAEHMWSGDREWLAKNAETAQRTLQAIRDRGPMASADFERDPSARRVGAWDWYGPKESRRALEVLWTTGDLMIHSRRSGQKVYDLRERVLEEALGSSVPRDDELPGAEERLRHFVRRTVAALGVVTPSWMWDYFRLAVPAGVSGAKRGIAIALLQELCNAGVAVPVEVEGLSEPAFMATERLDDLQRLRGGMRPSRTTLLSPFDSLIWDRARARVLFDYEVCFEAYVPPPKRRYGYYCLAILHQGRLVGRVDPKMDRLGKRLVARVVHLEPGIEADDGLVDGLAAALEDLARFLGGREVVVERSDPAPFAARLTERLRGPIPV